MTSLQPSPDHERFVQLATWAGAHALPLFAIALVGLLASAGLFWYFLLRFAGRPGHQRLSPFHSFLLRIGVGFVAVGAAGVVFGELVHELAEQELDPIDQAFMGAIGTHVSPATRHVFQLLTRCGDTATVTVIGIATAVALLAWRHRALALAWAAVVSGGTALNWLLKQYFARVRPVHDGFEAVTGFSFPSGHSAGSVIVYGMLAYLAMRLLPTRWHVPVALLTTALAVSVGASRLFLGVHFPSDVLAGFTVGVAWLGVCLASIEAARLRQWRRGARSAAQTPTHVAQ